MQEECERLEKTPCFGYSIGDGCASIARSAEEYANHKELL